jgi:hypothetical protein
MNKRHSFFGMFSVLALAALAAGLTPQLAKADNAQCNLGNSIMNGTYVASGTGTVAGVGPIAVVGELIYNGDGTGYVVMLTQSVNGATSTATKVPVSFTVNPDCTGSKTVGTGHYNFVITPDGSLITWIVTDNGVTLMGTGVRMKK